MIVCEEYDADEQELADSVYALYVLNNRDIKLIELSVGNYLGTGASVGYIAGALAGLAAYSESGRGFFVGFYNMVVAVAGGLVGAILGGTIGIFFTHYEDVYEQENPEEYDFTQLNIYARYGASEPEYLEAIK